MDPMELAPFRHATDGCRGFVGPFPSTPLDAYGYVWRKTIAPVVDYFTPNGLTNGALSSSGASRAGAGASFGITSKAPRIHGWMRQK